MNALSGEIKKEFIYQSWSKSIIRSQVGIQKLLKTIDLRELLKSLGKSLCMLVVMFFNEKWMKFSSFWLIIIRLIRRPSQKCSLLLFELGSRVINNNDSNKTPISEIHLGWVKYVLNLGCIRSHFGGVLPSSC